MENISKKRIDCKKWYICAKIWVAPRLSYQIIFPRKPNSFLSSLILMYMKSNISYLGFKPLFFLFAWSFCVGSVWGQTWTDVGTPAPVVTAFMGHGQTSDYSMCVGQNYATYLAYVTGANNPTPFTAKVMRAVTPTSAWETLPPMTLPGEAQKIIIKTDNQNQLYACVSYSQYNAYGSKYFYMTVKKLVENSWQTIGDSFFSIGKGLYTMEFCISPNNLLYAVSSVGYLHASQSAETKIHKFNGTNWQTINNPNIFGHDVKIAVNASEIPYAVWIDSVWTGSNDLYIMKVQKYENGVWSDITPIPTTVQPRSGSQISMKIANNGDVYVLYTEETNNNTAKRIRVLQHNGTWQHIGGYVSSSSTNGALTWSFPQNDALAITPTGRIYAIYGEQCCADAIPQSLPSNITIKSFDGASWNVVGNFTGTPNTNLGSVQIGNNGNPFMAYTLTSGTQFSIYTKTFQSCPPAFITTDLLPSYQTNLNITFSQSGLIPFGVTSWFQSNLPAGLSLSSSGVLTGFPTIAGTYTFTIWAKRTGVCYAIRTYTVSFCPPVSINQTSIPTPQSGVSYPATLLTQTGFTGAVTWSISAGSLPAGLSLTPNNTPTTGGATISGIPTTTGSFNFTVRISQNGCSTTRTYSGTVAPSPCPTISISPATLPDGKVGELYTQALSQNGLNDNDVLWTLLQFPNGMGVSPTGTITFTPNAIGTVTFTVRVSKTSLPSCGVNKTYTIKIPSACASISPFVIPTAYYCTPYSITFGASGAGITWTMAGNIPGLTLNTNGVLSGIPEGISNGGQALNYSFTITRKQGTCTVSKTYKLKVACPAPGVIPDPIGGGGTRDLLRQE
jgi:hypothetical protein